MLSSCFSRCGHIESKMVLDGMVIACSKEPSKKVEWHTQYGHSNIDEVKKSPSPSKILRLLFGSDPSSRVGHFDP